MSRELDAKVAEKVMKLPDVEFVGGRLQFRDDERAKEYGGTWSNVVPSYSTDISAAMEVVEKLDAHTFLLKRFNGPNGDGVVWHAEFMSPDAMAVACTAPEAICLAALATVTAEEK